jgi:hypothetical protein
MSVVRTVNIENVMSRINYLFLKNHPHAQPLGGR